MAVTSMDMESDHSQAGKANTNRKRKHKNKDKDEPSPSKKRKKHLVADEAISRNEKSQPKSHSLSPKDKTKAKTIATPAQLPPQSDSPFHLTTATLYLPLSPISISPTHALASLLAEHLSPLLLTYYPPLKGIILAYSNASISSTPPQTSSTASFHPESDNPQQLTLALTANEYGVLYIYLTATFLVFRPQRGQTLEGWVNVQSEGFVGAVVFNLFSVGIERKRLHSTWQWVPPGEEQLVKPASKTKSTTGTKPNPSALSASNTSSSTDEDEDRSARSFNPEIEHFRPVSLSADQDLLYETTTALRGGKPESKNLDNDAMDLSTDDNALENSGAARADTDVDATGYFKSVSGHRVRGLVRFRVVDVDIIPGSERDSVFLSIEGTMLSREEEAKVLEAERNGVIGVSSRLGGLQHQMSGALAAPSGPTGADEHQDNEGMDVSHEGDKVKEVAASGTASKKKKKSKEKEKESKEIVPKSKSKKAQGK